MKLDEIDYRLLDLLQRDSKMTVKQLSEQLNLSTTPIFERIKKLERSGIINSYGARIERKSLGLATLVFCNVSLIEHQAGQLSQFEADVQNLSEVLSCYHIGGLHDYLLKVLVRDMEDYHQFVSKTLAGLSNIGKVHSSFVMSEVKTERGLPLKQASYNNLGK